MMFYPPCQALLTKTEVRYISIPVRPTHVRYTSLLVSGFVPFLTPVFRHPRDPIHAMSGHMMVDAVTPRGS